MGLGEGLWEGAAAHRVPAGRCNQTQCMVRTLKVVEVSPSVKATLAVGEVGVCPSLEQLGLEGPVEALELAKGLGMVRPAVDQTPSWASQTLSGVKGWSRSLPQGEPLSISMVSGMP